MPLKPMSLKRHNNLASFSVETNGARVTSNANGFLHFRFIAIYFILEWHLFLD